MSINANLDRRDVHGSSRVHHYSCVADGVDQEIDTGFNVVDGVSYAPKSMTTALVSISKNLLSSGTASVGYVSVTGIASGDEFYLTVWGH